MYQIEVHKNIARIIEFFYQVGIWNRQDVETIGQRRLKLFYFLYYFLYPLSFTAGAVASDNEDEKILMVQSSIMSLVLLLKLWYLIWRKTEILDLLHIICDYRVVDRETVKVVSDKLDIFMKFITVFLCAAYFSIISVSFVAPFIGEERKLFLPIGFPLDWRNSEFAYWMAVMFIVTEMIISSFLFYFSVIVWYLIANCSWRYDVLGEEVRKMGKRRREFYESEVERPISNTDTDNWYHQDLIAAFTSHCHLKELTDRLESFLSNVFTIQLTISGVCICASIYSLVFARGDNLIELAIYAGGLLYNLFEIFVITFLGNEIKWASDRLLNHLFESDWIDRSLSIKKNMLIYGEIMMRPHQLNILKTYPLTLATFMRVLKSAYSMFNVLKNFK